MKTTVGIINKADNESVGSSPDSSVLNTLSTKNGRSPTKNSALNSIGRGFSEAFSEIKITEQNVTSADIESNPLFIHLKHAFQKKLNIKNDNEEADDVAEIEQEYKQLQRLHQIGQQHTQMGGDDEEEDSIIGRDEDVIEKENIEMKQFGLLKKLKTQQTLLSQGKFFVHKRNVYYSHTSLWIMDQYNPIRQVLVWIIEWRWFDRFILLLILMNACILAIYDYTESDSNKKFNRILNIISDVLTSCFLLEALFKILAQGFIFHQKAYLRDVWNIVDFVIVLTGIADFIKLGINMKAVRILRVLRPLRTLKAIPSMRRLVSTLLQSLPELGNAGIFLSFMTILFTILGLQQFTGVLYHRCRLTEKPLNSTYWPKSETYTNVCSPKGEGAFSCPKGLYCGSPLDYGISLEDDGVFQDPDIQFGVSNFDNFGQALLAVIQAITIEQWTGIMYNLSDGYTSFFTQLYFCGIVIIGHFYMLQFLLAVIMTNLNKIQSEEAFEQIQAKQKLVQKDQKAIQIEKKRLDELAKEQELARAKEEPTAASNKAQFSELIKALKQAKEEKAKQKQAEEHLNTVKNQMISRLSVSGIGIQVVNSNKEQDAKEKQRAFDEKIKGSLMWGISQQNNKDGSQQAAPQDLSKGIGLAILSKVLGVQKIESKYQTHLERIKKTLLIHDYDIRLKLQNRIHQNLGRVVNKIDYNVAKMYYTSKKSVYGIEHELHLVEQIHRTLKGVFTQDLLSRQITFDDLRDNFPSKSEDYLRLIFKDEDPDFSFDPELDLHMNLTLKLAFNLKDLSMKQNVKQFFFARFKRQLIKKNIVDKILKKTQNYVMETQVLKRSQTFWLYGFSLKVVTSKFFKFVSILIITANSVTLGLSSYGNSRQFEENLEYLNLAFFSFFLFELIVKLLGQGFKQYFQEKINWFDCTIVLVSCLDVALQYSLASTGSSSGALTVLRVFRLLRVFQLAKVWKDFQELMLAIQSTIKDVTNISILILIFLFTYTLIGLELFALKLPESNDISNSTFDSFLEGFLSVFIVLANDGWTRIYIDHYRHAGSVVSSFYFLSLLFIGQFILLNLFIAILIENFEQISVKNDLVNKLKEMEREPLWVRIKYAICFWQQPAQAQKRSSVVDRLTDEEYQNLEQLLDFTKQQSPSLFVISYDGKLRQLVLSIIQHKFFEWFILSVIFMNTIQLAVDNPLRNPNDLSVKALTYIDYILTTIFTLEALLKIIGFGFAFCGSTSYIRSQWNVLDLSVVALTLLSYGITTRNLNSIKVIRLLKVLRPLRAISKNQSMKVSIAALGIAISGIITIMVVSLLFYFVFGIIGINYFSGMFYDCTQNGLVQSIEHKWDCLNFGGVWDRQYFNFDSTPQAISTLFIISTTVQWSDVMYRASKLREIDMTPGQEITSTPAALFFVLIIIIGNFFLMNLFVGIIITTYNRQKDLAGTDFMLTEQQKKWVKDRMMILQSQPKFKMQVPVSQWKKPFFYIAQDKYFENFILLCIVGNTIILTITWYGMPSSFNGTLETLNYVFTCIFTTEFLIKYIGYGNRYFKDPWNTFDLVIVCITLLGIIISSNSAFNLGPQTTIIRSFRIARLFFFFKRNRALKGTFMTFLVTLPAMANIGSLLILIILIYAILGVYLFAEVKPNGAIDQHANFQTLGISFLTLIRVITGEEWPKLMEAVAKTNGPNFACVEDHTYEIYAENNFHPTGCGDPSFAMIYFFSFIIVICLVFLKLFIAIILQTFQQTTERDSKFMNSQLSDNFRDAWSHYDPDATSFMASTSYAKFLLQLGEPLGWDSTFNHNFIKQQEYLAELSLPKYNCGKEYQFMDVFEHLVLIMIIRREIINFAFKNNRFELLGDTNDKDDEENFSAPYESPRRENVGEVKRRNFYLTSSLEESVKRKQIMNNQSIEYNKDMLMKDYKSWQVEVPKKAGANNQDRRQTQQQVFKLGMIKEAENTDELEQSSEESIKAEEDHFERNMQIVDDEIRKQGV